MQIYCFPYFLSLSNTFLNRFHLFGGPCWAQITQKLMNKSKHQERITRHVDTLGMFVSPHLHVCCVCISPLSQNKKKEKEKEKPS
jgi:hypothetical protein